jgi:hypothetical protein
VDTTLQSQGIIELLNQNSMHIIKEVPIPIYFGTLVIIFTDQLENLNPIYKTNIVEDDYDAVVFLDKPDSNKVIVAIKKKDWSVIAHETVHVVNAIFLSCNIQLDRNNDEPQAYLTGWVVNEIDKFLTEVESKLK